AVGAGSTAAAGVHLVTHAAFKALLFLAAGIALHAAGTLDLGSLRLGRVLPFTAASFAVGAVALAAVPPLGGAWSKEEILAAAGHQSAWLGAAVVVAGFLSALYAGRLALLAFGPGSGAVGHRPTPVERASLAVLAAATIALGVLWLPGADAVVEQVTGGRLSEAGGWELPASLLAVGAAVVVVGALSRRGRLLTMALPEGASAALASWLGLPTLARRVVVDPVLSVSHALGAFDDRVVDAGVRAAARVPVVLSRAASWWGERGLDDVVGAVSGGTLRAAAASRAADERAVDRAVEELARGTGVAGRNSRRLQDGLAHHYYVIVAVGLATAVAVAALGR
ncbi:MAG: NADH-quinone oxidoreductase subunit L, partial [Actinomycetota bacterium]|nr:NADH-quinone oxidoreductase subunit L [Actinomycetota bacterium]